LSNNAERSPRQARHLSFIAKFTSDIQFIQGQQTVLVDVLSRVNAVTIPLIDFQQLAVDQASFSEIIAYRPTITNLVLQKVPFHDVTLLCDVSLGKPRPITCFFL